MKHFSHLNTAVQLVEQYKGELPFSIFLKSFFSQHKKYGSRDRKSISHLCYCYFRLGHAISALAVEEKILTGLFLVDHHPVELLEQLKPEWNKKIQLSIDEKVGVLHGDNIPFSLKDIFPWKDGLSEGIDHEQFCRSFLIQPDLFIRLRPGHEEKVKQKLRNAGIELTEVSASCLALPNATKIDEEIALDKEAVVQDLNSQRTGNFFAPEHFSAFAGLYTAKHFGETDPQSESRSTHQPSTLNSSRNFNDKKISRPASSKSTTLSTWDCCAASGGKSILAYDLIPNIELIVSDVRESIIHNLKKRFEEAGIKNYRAFVIDLVSTVPDLKIFNNRPNPTGQHRTTSNDSSGPNLKPQTLNIQPTASNPFDLIICDAPCSGSGTWSRTPEQLMFFKQESDIDHYSNLQRKIISNVIPHLKQGGRFVYITCSVFKKENEETVEFIRNQFSLQLERMEILKGYDKKADTLFVASFIRK